MPEYLAPGGFDARIIAGFEVCGPWFPGAMDRDSILSRYRVKIRMMIYRMTGM
jgi:hypothetical protein